MSTENQEVSPSTQGEQQVVETEGQEQPKQLSKIEQQALEMGWRPQEEFDGDPEDFIDAKEFVRRKPLFDKIEHTTKELKAVRKALDAMKTHYTKVQETEFNRAMKQLKEAQKQALVDSDPERFYEIESQREELQKEKEKFVQESQEMEVRPEQDSVNPQFAAWVNRNPWYQSKPHMRVFAEEVGMSYSADVRAGRKTPEDVLKLVEQAVREEFPHQFRNRNKDNVSAVEEGSTRRSGGSSGSGGAGSLSAVEKSLTEDERRIMNRLTRDGHITKEQYLKDLKAIKGN